VNQHPHTHRVSCVGRVLGSGVRYQSADWFPWQQQHACGSYRCVYKRRTLCSGQVVFYLVDKSSISHSIILSSRWGKQESIARLSPTFQQPGDVGDSVIHSSLSTEVKFVLTSTNNRWRWVFCFTPRPLYSRWKNPWYILHRSPCWLLQWAWLLWEQKKLWLCRDSYTCSPATQPVTCLLYWLFLVYLKIIFKLRACGDVGSDVELRSVVYFEVMQAD
jgi:hypothetical protein